MKKDKKVKEKRIKKKLSAETSSDLTTLIVILVTLGITISLHFIFPDKLSSYWVIAICVAVISPFALTNFKINMEAKGNFTEEQKKAATSKLGIMMLSIWYADFTFICMFMDWLIAFFILAGLYLIKMIYNVASVFVNRKDATTYPNFLIIGDFVLSFLLLTLLIYKIPDQTLQTIVIALSAALIGGLLTLLGVIMTIKKSDKDRIEDEIKKARPVFAYNMLRQEPKLDAVVQRVCISDSSEQLQDACDVYVELENSNLSSFEIKRVNHDGTWVKMEGNATVLPSAKCLLNFRFIDNPNSLFLEIEDQLGNNYYYQLFVLFLGTKSSNDMALHTVREIKNIKKEELEMIMKEAK